MAYLEYAEFWDDNLLRTDYTLWCSECHAKIRCKSAEDAQGVIHKCNYCYSCGIRLDKGFVTHNEHQTERRRNALPFWNSQ